MRDVGVSVEQVNPCAGDGCRRSGGADEKVLHIDLVLVTVRAEQLVSTLPVLTSMNDDSHVLFFGNTANREAELRATLGDRVLFGLPAAGGTLDGPVLRYVLISQQKTMLGEHDGATSPRVRHLQSVLEESGFPTLISANIADWLVGHAAFVVPIAFALYRFRVNPARLAADPATTRSPRTCASSTASRREPSSATGAVCSTAPGENCGSAPASYWME